MRRISTIAALLVFAAVTAGCSRHDESSAATNNAVAPAGFVPPTALNRTDFVDMVDKRFTALDLNRDSIIEPSEIPARHHDIIAGFDADHDGKITVKEFEQGSLVRFDAADHNQDEVLTGEERRGADLTADNRSDAVPVGMSNAD